MWFYDMVWSRKHPPSRGDRISNVKHAKTRVFFDMGRHKIILQMKTYANKTVITHYFEAKEGPNKP